MNMCLLGRYNAEHFSQRLLRRLLVQVELAKVNTEIISRTRSGSMHLTLVGLQKVRFFPSARCYQGQRYTISEA